MMNRIVHGHGLIPAVCATVTTGMFLFVFVCAIGSGCAAAPEPRPTYEELRATLLEQQKLRDAEAAAHKKTSAGKNEMNHAGERFVLPYWSPVSPGETLLSGAFPLGDLTFSNGNVLYLQDGSLLLRQQNGATTFQKSETPGLLPQFVHNSRGQLVGPLRITTGERPLVRPPSTPARTQGFSSMPTMPDVAPPPDTDRGTRIRFQGLQPGFSNLPARPEIAPSPVRNK